VALPIEDYGLIGDTHTAALVGRDGSIDWLCLPRFDSDACFAKLLGDESNGYWRIAPVDDPTAVRRRYRGESLVLETEMETADGVVRIVDCMPIREDHPQVVRVAVGLSGRVDMRTRLVMRFGNGTVVPWVRRTGSLVCAIAGPDALSLWTPAHTHGQDMTTVANFALREGDVMPFVLTYYPSHVEAPRPVDPRFALEDTQMWWEDWASTLQFEGPWRDAVMRSLVTLKALTYSPTGGIVAAPTTSLPETLGGVRNWDYRYCWLRDATLTLESLMRGGYFEEAMAWRNWLLRAVAGDPADLQIMYGTAGERNLVEREVPWLKGYENATPVRVGNAAAGQFQLDVYGEVMSALYVASRVGGRLSDTAWALQTVLMGFVEEKWSEPDDGIWEVRGPRRHFTHSKVMAWVAFDRAVRMVEECGQPGPVDKWRELRDKVHAEVCAQGFNEKVGAFTQYYGSDALDASLLMMPLFGFLPATDDRVRSTIEAIERDLTEDGFVLRYRASDAHDVDGLEGHEGAFLACSFWMADCLHLLGRHDDAVALFERLVGLCNDLGLLSEEYDALAKRQVGNFPQAFSHVSLVNAAYNLSGHGNIDDVVADSSVLHRLTQSRLRQWRQGRSAPRRPLDHSSHRQSEKT
jgi:GH15 family glucan-1,4-alpha-glucosidase